MPGRGLARGLCVRGAFRFARLMQTPGTSSPGDGKRVASQCFVGCWMAAVGCGLYPTHALQQPSRRLRMRRAIAPRSIRRWVTLWPPCGHPVATLWPPPERTRIESGSAISDRFWAGDHSKTKIGAEKGPERPERNIFKIFFYVRDFVGKFCSGVCITRRKRVQGGPAGGRSRAVVCSLRSLCACSRS